MVALCLSGMHGIDFGAKLAGTTVIATLDENSGNVTFAASAKKQDADQFILGYFTGKPASVIYLDAPLSLPMVYANPQIPEPDYFYRACDKALGAMSPMFLGGLTARAMSLSQKLRDGGHLVYETYPGALAKTLNLSKIGYKKDIAQIPICAEAIGKLLGKVGIGQHIPNWHHFDALLALHSAIRASKHEAQEFGNPEEGVICF